MVCPLCHLTKKIHIPQNMLKEGLTTISIPKDSVCTHHFQVFIDRKFKIRGYQKVDLELGDEEKTVHFKCQLCNADINFKPSDETSYISMEPYKKFLGKELRSYKIAHYKGDELHVNNVILEEDGTFNGILNSHVVKLEQHENTARLNLKYFSYSEEDKQALTTHPIYDVLIIFNTHDHWMHDLVCSPLFNAVDLTAVAHEKMEEAMTIYFKVPPYMNVSIADKTFHLWISDFNVTCINLKDESNIHWLKPLLLEFMEKASFEGNLISYSPRLLLINEVFNGTRISEAKLPLIRRLIFDDLLYSKIKIKYEEYVDSILNKVLSQIKLERSLVLGFFHQDKSIIEYLRLSKKLEHLEEFLEMIDFINRRKLLE